MDMKEEKTSVFGFSSSEFLHSIERGLDRTLERTKLKAFVNFLTERIWNWGRRNSLWPLHWGIMCCSIEMAATSAPRFDIERFGVIYRSTPRQIDVLLVTGPISHKLAPAIRRLWEQIPEPKWVVAMGECAICGGPYYDSYSVLPGVNEVIPVDIYIPGCPVRPEALIDGFLKLRDRIKSEKQGMFMLPK
jgi:NADH-quinone oxidoreductase subunit B